MIILYNTLEKIKKEFKPIDQQNIRMYVCGPTVDNYAHIGNARPIVIFDVLFRLLQKFYPKVTYVRNITDVDDKINAAALNNNEDIRTLTDRTIKFYHEDIAALNALPPTHEPRATDHIPDMIDMIGTLIANGFAYESDGHVLFRVKQYKRYGELSRKNADELKAGARIEVASYKEEAGDFVLWKPSSEDMPGWDSPWGRGRPGWHIECSAMSKQFLGETFDIHGGGIDLVFPHHENESAQSCCANNSMRMANFWMHNGHVMVNGNKMSKSLGNFFTVRDLLAIAPAEAIRFVLLSSHYRQPLDFSNTVLSAAQSNLNRLYNAISYADSEIFLEDDLEVTKALCDDLNTPLAISYLYEMTNRIFKTSGNEQKKIANRLKANANLLGLLEKKPDEWFRGGSEVISEDEIKTKILERSEAKNQKEYSKADDIRKELLAKGIALEDYATETTWRKI